MTNQPIINITIDKEQQAVTTSKNVADNFEREHRNVTREIDKLIKEDPLNFEQMFREGNEPDSYGRPQKVYYMNRDGFSFLVMGFTGKKAMQFKLAYIEQFNKMEKQIVNSSLKLPSDPMAALKLMFQATEETNESVEEVKERVTNLEENAPINPSEYQYIGKRVSQKVYQVGRERALSMNKDQKTELFKAINSEIKQITGIKIRSQLKNRHFNQVVDFIDEWEPSSSTRHILNQMESLTEEGEAI